MGEEDVGRESVADYEEVRAGDGSQREGGAEAGGPDG